MLTWNVRNIYLLILKLPNLADYTQNVDWIINTFLCEWIELNLNCSIEIYKKLWFIDFKSVSVIIDNNCVSYDFVLWTLTFIIGKTISFIESIYIKDITLFLNILYVYLINLYCERFIIIDTSCFHRNNRITNVTERF